MSALPQRFLDKLRVNAESGCQPPVVVCPDGVVPSVVQATIFDADPTPAHGIVRPDLRVVGE